MPPKHVNTLESRCKCNTPHLAQRAKGMHTDGARNTGYLSEKRKLALVK